MESDFVHASRDAGFRSRLADLLLKICAIDTTPRSDVADFALAEDRVFGLIEERLLSLGLAGLKLTRKPIDPGIESHPFYSRPYYTRTPQRPDDLPAKQAYQDRANLVATIEGTGGATGGLALNAHIDVVQPYIPPCIDGATLYGRGACDDKGPVVAILGALELAAGYFRQTGRRPARPLTAMFVIDEEMGGNGSLSMALDRELRRRYQTMVVMECCSSKIYPANRGALWYKIQAKQPGINLFEAFAFIIDELEREGRAIKAESRHPLFPHRPVQTCHGILGSFGQHPSRICGSVAFVIRGFAPLARPLLDDLLADAINQYIALYGDKTRVIDPATNLPKVHHHFDAVPENDGVTIYVHGATGHMGSILQNDGAITKMATIVRTLLASRSALEAACGRPVQLELAGESDSDRLVMEGGQGFLPTHPMPQIMERIRQAACRGMRRYALSINRADLDPGSILNITFDKLHNAAFAGDPDSPAMKAALAAAVATGIRKPDEPVVGWDVSCDARIFASEYPDLSVITTGPGHLIHAHADAEQINLDELASFTAFLAQFIVSQLDSHP